MKKLSLSILCFAVLLLGTTSLFGQTVPQGFNYQCIVRDLEDKPLANAAVTLIFTIRDSSASGDTVYAEKHQVTTNAFGLVNLIIGNGSSPIGNFSSIDWGSNAKYLAIALETTPGNSQPIGSSQLLSVPYALYALQAAESAKDKATLWITGAEIPAAILGKDNDFYLQSTTGDFYQKIAGGWVNQGSLKGVQGEPGQRGEMGPPGSAGAYTSGAGIAIQGNVISNKGDTIETDDIKNTTQAGGDLSGTFTTLQINAGAIGSVEIATGAVVADKIAPNAINNSDKITDGVIKAVDLAPGVIPASLPPSGAAGGDLMGNYPNPSVTNNAITAPKIAPNAITSDKISDGTIAANDLNNMGAGEGQVLKFMGGRWTPFADVDNQFFTFEPISHTLGLTGSTATIIAGDITAVTAGTGLTGSATSGAVNINAQTTEPLWNANRLQGRIVADNIPQHDQVLKWNQNTFQWEPRNITSSGGGGSSISDCGKIESPDTDEQIAISNLTDDDDAICGQVAQLAVKTNLQEGLLVDVQGNGDAKGLRIATKGGSASNDGVILFSQSGNAGASGIKMAVSSGNPSGNTENDIVGLSLVAGDNDIIDVNNVDGIGG